MTGMREAVRGKGVEVNIEIHSDPFIDVDYGRGDIHRALFRKTQHQKLKQALENI
jgi:hypothetical protein